MAYLAHPVPILDRFVRDEISTVPTPYDGHIRYHAKPTGVDSTPLRIVGLLPQSDWYVLACPDGQLTAIRETALVQELCGLHSLKEAWRNCLAGFKTNHEYLWFVLAVLAIIVNGHI